MNLFCFFLRLLVASAVLASPATKNHGRHRNTAQPFRLRPRATYIKRLVLFNNEFELICIKISVSLWNLKQKNERGKFDLKGLRRGCRSAFLFLGVVLVVD